MSSMETGPFDGAGEWVRRGVRSGTVALLGAAVLGTAWTGAAEAQVPVPDTLAVLDTIPVVGSRVSSTLPMRSRGVQVLDRAALDELPVSDIAGALGWALGVELAARSPAQVDVSMRGAGFEHVLVMVDGVRMSDPQTGHFDLNLTLPLAGVERIEVLRGPASAAYGGDAVGGVVNIVTRDAPGWEMTAEGGSFATFRGSVRGSTTLPAGARLILSAEEANSDGHREGTDWEHRLLNAGVRAPLLGGRVTADLGRATRDFGADNFYAPFPSFESTVASTASIRWRPAAGARIRVEPRLAWRSHDDDFILVRDDPSIYRNQHTSSQLTGDLTLRGELGRGVAWAAGGELQRSRLESNLLGERSEDRRSVFAELGWERLRLGTFGATVGIRHDDHDAFGGATSPSVTGFAQLSDALRVRASWGRAFRGPSWTERYYVDPAHAARADLDPERSSSIEGALVLTPGGGLELSAGAFRRVSRDLIDWATGPGEASVEDGGVWVTRNVNRAEFLGLEFDGRWATDALLVTAGVSLLSLDADAEPGFESKYALRPLTEQVTLGVARDLAGGVRGSVKGLHGKRPGEGSFRMLDLRLERQVLDGRAHLELRNLADSGHLDITGNPVAGRAFVIGYRIALR